MLQYTLFEKKKIQKGENDRIYLFLMKHARKLYIYLSNPYAQAGCDSFLLLDQLSYQG